MTVFSDSLYWEETQKPHKIGSTTVLPARRESVTLKTEDGLALVGELATPERQVPRAVLVTLHPLPTAGGFMESHIFRKASFRLPALADIAVLRFNTRGTSSIQGASEGYFDEGVGERFDVEAAVRWASARGLDNIWLFGWSFGTELVLKYGAIPPVAPLVTGGILLSPPLHRATDSDLRLWAESGKPLKVLVPEEDDYLSPREARKRFELVPQAKFVEGTNAKHLWVGQRQTDFVLNQIAGTVRGSDFGNRAFGPLPTVWQGKFAKAR